MRKFEVLLYHLSPFSLGSLLFDVNGSVNINCESSRKKCITCCTSVDSFEGKGEGREPKCLFARYKSDRALRISLL